MTRWYTRYLVQRWVYCILHNILHVYLDAESNFDISTFQGSVIAMAAFYPLDTVRSRLQCNPYLCLSNWYTWQANFVLVSSTMCIEMKHRQQAFNFIKRDVTLRQYPVILMTLLPLMFAAFSFTLSCLIVNIHIICAFYRFVFLFMQTFYVYLYVILLDWIYLLNLVQWKCKVMNNSKFKR